MTIITYQVVSTKHNVRVNGTNPFKNTCSKHIDNVLREYYAYELDTPKNELEIIIL
ncbi:hypothetical protein [Niallia sp. FSL K6-0077]|uniref:hypothetical protein n=1 Tax=Niallia sp. FSL K6-0077 TaxID=2954743 RepID=UPI0030F638E0